MSAQTAAPPLGSASTHRPTAMIHRDGVDLAVHHFAFCRGRPLLLLHGLSGSSSSWQPVADALGPGWCAIALDLRGHGDSGHDTGGYSFADHCADVSRLLAEIGEPVVLVGHSLGGVVATHLAQVQHPLVRAVFLEDPPLYLFDPAGLEQSGFARVFTGLRDLVRRLQAQDAPVQAYCEAFGAAPHPAGDTQGDHMCEDALVSRATSLSLMDPDAFDAILDGRTCRGFRPELPIACPAELVRADPRYGAAFLPEHEALLAATSPHVRVTELAGGAHNLRGDRATRRPYLDRLTTFLGSL